ncbi:hypothetical protein HLB44_36565 [Aquincola sp. S2]|uniref:Uncharacterized protein n=1 Tax=Pseudaquabacterium terrae TaxID=2732868 RepID=A0ABX2EV06_9BURK|nr:hypothetical protein [Aquabacterium terrae]NRF72477.1 hypothetical protein [Aquabacterium terrae]
MRTVPSILIAASALVILTLGVLHLVFTYRGTKFHPRDPSLLERLKEVSPVISRETTMWRASIGFRASHSFGAMLFGLVYGYLALESSGFLFKSPFLMTLGLVCLCAYLVLGKLYWFKVPFRGIFLATALYASALVATWA